MMKPEELAEIELYSMLRPCVKEIYFNRVNHISAPTFKIKSGDKKSKYPDLLLKDNNDRYIGLEVKPSSQTSKLQGGKNQLLERYYIPYVLGNTKYYVNGEEVKIDLFLFTTEMIKYCRLFPEREHLGDNLENPDKFKQDCVKKYKNIPRYEYSRTYDLVRSMFSQLKEWRQENEKNMVNIAGYGILNKDLESEKFMKFCIHKLKKDWRQHYWEL